MKKRWGEKLDLLLDTHVLLWWLEAPERLADNVKASIASEHRRVFVSALSAWEIVIKVSIGKLRLQIDLEEEVERSRFEHLDVSLRHGLTVRELPLLHRDPFDRLLIAQARIEGLTIVTRDPRIRQYDVPVLAA
jgi:PIN domain nuclease of toxin-antitoxin system